LNPEVGSYEDLVCTAAARELDREKQEQELERSLHPLTHELKEMIGEDKMKDLDDSKKIEMYLSLKGQKAGEQDVDDAAPPHVRHRQKSQAQKNKAKKNRLKDEAASQEKQQRCLEKSVGEVGSLLKEMKQEKELSETRRKNRANIQAEKRRLEETEGVVPKKRQLGRAAFEERALIVPDVETAKKGLRAARLKDSAIHERVSSIMRRGLLPAAPVGSKSELVRHTKRSARLKRSRKFISPLLRGSGGMLGK
jgi:hypothetical protein